MQGDDDVGAELFSLKNLLGNLFRDFCWDRVMALHLEEKVKDENEHENELLPLNLCARRKPIQGSTGSQCI